MRVKLRHLGFGLMLMFLPPGLNGCSSSQQEDDQLEVSEDENSEQGEDEEFDDSKNLAEEDENFDNSNENEKGNENEEGNELADNDVGEDFDNSNFQQSNENIQDIVSDLNQGAEGNELGAEMVTNPENGTNLAEMTPDAGLSDVASTGGAAPALPEFGSKMPYIVQTGDTLAKISAKVYGQSNRWTDIAELSSLSNPSRIFPGDVIYYQLTEETLAFATSYESLPKQEVVVSAGDTLTSISSRVYGNSMDWKIIWRHNDNISNPDKLETGTVLVYPETNRLAKVRPNHSKSQFAKHSTIEAKVIELNVQIAKADTSFDVGNSMFVIFAKAITGSSV
jgi:nucleoid-associated protein YgaU